MCNVQCTYKGEEYNLSMESSTLRTYSYHARICFLSDDFVLMTLAYHALGKLNADDETAGCKKVTWQMTSFVLHTIWEHHEASIGSDQAVYRVIWGHHELTCGSNATIVVLLKRKTLPLSISICCVPHHKNHLGHAQFLLPWPWWSDYWQTSVKLREKENLDTPDVTSLGWWPSDKRWGWRVIPTLQASWWWTALVKQPAVSVMVIPLCF